MPLLNGTVDDLIIKERKNIEKYTWGAIDLRVVFNKSDEDLLFDIDKLEVTWKKEQ